MCDTKDHETTQIDVTAEKPSQSSHAVIVGSEQLKNFEKYQHSLTRLEAFKQEWKCIMWCIYMFFVCILFGFDALAGGVVVSIEQFRVHFGKPFDGGYVVDANWQLGFLAATLFGLVFGGLCSSVGVAYLGRQITLGIAYCISIAGVCLQYYASNDAQFFGGKILTGVPLGIFTSVAPSYASEMAPLVIRGAITAGMNFATVLGQLIGYGVMRQASFYPDERQYKVLFATQWGFAAVGLLLLPFYPESPYWLVQHGRHEKARRNIEKLHKPGYDVDGKMAEIHDALARINKDNEGQGSMIECFNRRNIKRTLVATSMFFVQNACGNSWVIGYMSYFMQLGGMSAERSFDTSVGITGLMVIGNMAGWFWVEYFGRRNTALWGTIILCITLYLIGILACIKTNGAIWGQVAFMAVWGFVYQGTVGSVAWTISSETPTSRLRMPTQSLSTMMNGLSSCIWSFSLPYAINPDQGNLGGKIAFIFGSVLVFATIFIYFMVPETKDRTYVEIDQLWKQGVPPRKFKSTNLVIVTEEQRDR
ncbi:uncharacterized protein PV09_09454 [Verruconis gallopava]|uniref:Major facilitator superfamily (MFS) profile domain-containing protein n=1 Tax=Verruconis gallopava TaxID=253628 RepID=A0A0D1ZXJ4_9PEZI|nr:uncharacterized protein PV09_09454 [Verruconis gallopava]KIV98804.1 hypothetical protein PV09_09454 [Verruconis gallopava]